MNPAKRTPAKKAVKKSPKKKSLPLRQPRGYQTELPGRKLLATDPEDAFPMAVSEWKRLRGRVSTLINPIPHASNLAWTCIGITITIFLALIPWVAAKPQLPPETQVEFAWVTPACILGGIFSFVLAVYAGWVSWRWRKDKKGAREEVLSDMDDIHDVSGSN